MLPSPLAKSKWLSGSRAFEPAPGELLGPRLRLVRPVADGRSTSIWVADHLALAMPVEVALASFDPATPADAIAEALACEAQRFACRAELTASINEPYLVQIIEHGEVKGVPFVVTELLEARGMRHRLAHGAASLAEIQTVVTQGCDALAKAHSLGVAHGALCPDVLFVTEVAQQPFLKIDGFGAGDAGSQSYASPEQLLLGTGSDARADLWAFAVTLYELLTTTLPFEAATPAGITVAICNAQFAPPSQYRADLPPGIDAWFARALAKEPGDRFADAAELARGFALALMPEASAAAAAPESDASLDADDDDEDDGDEDEKTVKWDLPEGWASSVERALSGAASPPPLPALGAPPPPQRSSTTVSLPTLPPPPAPLAGSRPPAAAALPAPLSAAELSSVALPATSQRASTSPHAAASAQVAASSRVATLPPSLEPAVYLDSPYIASVASALAVPVESLDGAPPSSRYSRRPSLLSRLPALASSLRLPARLPPLELTRDKAWLAAAAFAAGVAVTWFAYDPAPSSADAAEITEDSAAEIQPVRNEGSIPIRTLSVDDLPTVPGEEGTVPAIIRTNQLPAAEDEEPARPAIERAPVARTAPPPERRSPAPVQKVHALVPAPAKPAAKAATAHGSCSPPYYFDAQGIQRLKKECLDGSGVITGPYGAVIATNVATKAPAAGASPKPASTKSSSGNPCSPPYYFDGNIRRVKLECL